MVKRYLDKYFQIIDTKLTEADFQNQRSIVMESSANDQYKSWVERVLQNWKVNADVFNFFLSRKQFI
jgi:hypothetical protein